jgi:teichuronic acid biosynthesis glycosyltransferase TuaC
LRVVVVTNFFPTSAEPYRGRPTYEIVRSLKKMTPVAVVCPHVRYPGWLKPRNFDYRPISTDYKLPDVDVEYLRFPAIPWLTRATNGLCCAHYLLSRLRQYQPDIILNFWLYPQGYAAVQAGKRLGVPVVVGSIGSDLNRIADPITRYFVSQTLRGADVVVTKSQHLRQQAIRQGVAPEKVRAIPNGCDSSIFYRHDRSQARQQMNISECDPVIAYVGRLNKEKGLLEAAAAFATICHKWPSARLIVIGEGEFEQQIRSRVHELNIADRVTFTGAQDPRRVALWLGAANLLVLPSYSEGCPNSIVEALSSGRPVVATRVGGIPELVDDSCGILVPPRDTDALGKAIESALLRTWDERAIARHYRVGWDDVAKELYHILANARAAVATSESGMALV